MTYNIFHDGERAAQGILPWPQRSDAVVAMIQAESPDVLGVQEAEVWQVDWLLQQLPGYDAVARGELADPTLVDAETVAILYRRSRFVPRASGHFWYSESPGTPGSYGSAGFGGTSGPRMATWVRLGRRDAPAELGFYVFNTHFVADEGAVDPVLARAKSAELLAQRIADRSRADEYFFVIGDLNATPGQWPVTYLLQTPTFRMIDAWAFLHAGEATGGTRCNAVTGSAGPRVDYVLVWDPAPATISADISDAAIVSGGADCPSDHRPVVATFVLPLRPTAP
jgi:endonuclease/exonuclease/phosphatase family metal-dependent hydrolase